VNRCSASTIVTIFVKCWVLGGGLNRLSFSKAFILAWGGFQTIEIEFTVLHECVPIWAEILSELRFVKIVNLLAKIARCRMAQVWAQWSWGAAP